MLNFVPQFSSNMSVDIEFFQKLALATLIGILIGIEREHRRPEGTELIAGIRTFTIASITGMISSYLAMTINSGILLISLAFFAIVSAIYIYIKNVVLRQPGITGPIALYSTFLLGVLIAYDLYLIAIVGAVIITLLLAEKRPLHSFATNLTDEEIQSAVRFLAVVFIIYPITPDELFLGIINPRWILLIVIIVSTISFVSFVIMKQIGAKYGLPISGMLGGLVNSEAAAGAIAGMIKKRKDLVTSGHIGIILTNTAMLSRNLIISFIVDPSGRVLLLMLPPQLVIITLTIAAAIRSRTSTPADGVIRLESPFALPSAIRFALGFAGLSVVSKFAVMWAGSAGIYATALGGFISSAVVTASAASLAVNNFIPYSTAAWTAVLAGMISTGNKVLLVKWAGTPELMEMVKKTFTGIIIIGIIVLAIWGIFVTYA